MNVSGIIAELNPFHQGHSYLIEKVRAMIKDEVLIVIVSTCFSSRGLPSVMSVSEKTRKALKSGADLVIALPAVYAMQSADYFARYAIEALAKAGVSKLYFGSESADLDWIRQAERRMSTLAKDPSSSQARNASKAAVLRPNDLLALAYLRQADKYGIRPVAIRREQSLQSATSLRKEILESPNPENYPGCSPDQRWENYYPFLRYLLIESDPEQIGTFFLVEEGIEHRLIKNAKKYGCWKDFLEASISKTYSRARIQRTCMFILLQITKAEMKEHDSFDTIQVLGFSRRGQEHLRALSGSVPVCTRFARLPEFLKKVETKTWSLYNLAGKTNQQWNIVIESSDNEQ